MSTEYFSPTGNVQVPGGGLLDLQVNGYAGVDFQRDHLSLADLLAATRALRQDGAERFVPTLITDRWDLMIERLRHLRSLRAQSPELKAAIAGWHLEGPFLSESPGYHGAHEPAWMCDPTPQALEQLREAVGEDRVLLTLAPERPGALQAIALGASYGWKMCLGHTDASAACLREAIGAGASLFTHLGNGCPQLLDRHDNILWRVLDLPNLPVSLIPDGYHVSPVLFRLIHRLLPAGRIIYVSDTMAAGGAPPGRYTVGRLEVEVGADQIARQPGKSNFAGSALRPVEGVQRAAQMLRVNEEEVRRHFDAVPKQWLQDARETMKGC